ncbi:MAG TPA: TatD family hydrolase, partial [Candidatus Nitrosotenuis sp.]|nr:TatD family hydrolase [Candidatus Nitrosotenuis sp.]
ELRQVVRDVPLNRILVETDAPYLAPVPHRGKRNEPAFTRYTAEMIADLKQVSFDDVAKQTTQNFFNLFNRATMSP